MNINLTLEQVQELNQILGLLRSTDLENKLLGLQMFEATTVFQGGMYDYNFEAHPNKWIPVSWYISKAHDLANRQIEDTIGQYANSGWVRLLIPIIEAILLNEPKFKTDIIFNTDRSELMLHYHTTSLEERRRQLEEQHAANTQIN